MSKTLRTGASLRQTVPAAPPNTLENTLAYLARETSDKRTRMDEHGEKLLQSASTVRKHAYALEERMDAPVAPPSSSKMDATKATLFSEHVTSAARSVGGGVGVGGGNNDIVIDEAAERKIGLLSALVQQQGSEMDRLRAVAGTAQKVLDRKDLQLLDHTSTIHHLKLRIAALEGALKGRPVAKDGAGDDKGDDEDGDGSPKAGAATASKLLTADASQIIHPSPRAVQSVTVAVLSGLVCDAASLETHLSGAGRWRLANAILAVVERVVLAHGGRLSNTTADRDTIAWLASFDSGASAARAGIAIHGELMTSVEWPAVLLEVPNFSTEHSPNGDVLFQGARACIAIHHGTVEQFEPVGLTDRVVSLGPVVDMAAQLARHACPAGCLAISEEAMEEYDVSHWVASSMSIVSVESDGVTVYTASNGSTATDAPQAHFVAPRLLTEGATAGRLRNLLPRVSEGGPDDKEGFTRAQETALRHQGLVAERAGADQCVAVALVQRLAEMRSEYGQAVTREMQETVRAILRSDFDHHCSAVHLLCEADGILVLSSSDHQGLVRAAAAVHASLMAAPWPADVLKDGPAADVHHLDEAAEPVPTYRGPLLSIGVHRGLQPDLLWCPATETVMSDSAVLRCAFAIAKATPAGETYVTEQALAGALPLDGRLMCGGPLEARLSEGGKPADGTKLFSVLPSPLWLRNKDHFRECPIRRYDAHLDAAAVLQTNLGGCGLLAVSCADGQNADRVLFSPFLAALVARFGGTFVITAFDAPVSVQRELTTALFPSPKAALHCALSAHAWASAACKAEGVSAAGAATGARGSQGLRQRRLSAAEEAPTTRYVPLQLRLRVTVHAVGPDAIGVVEIPTTTAVGEDAGAITSGRSIPSTAAGVRSTASVGIFGRDVATLVHVASVGADGWTVVTEAASAAMPHLVPVTLRPFHGVQVPGERATLFVAVPYAKDFATVTLSLAARGTLAALAAGEKAMLTLGRRPRLVPRPYMAPLPWPSGDQCALCLVTCVGSHALRDEDPDVHAKTMQMFHKAAEEVAAGLTGVFIAEALPDGSNLVACASALAAVEFSLRLFRLLPRLKWPREVLHMPAFAAVRGAGGLLVQRGPAAAATVVIGAPRIALSHDLSQPRYYGATLLATLAAMAGQCSAPNTVAIPKAARAELHALQDAEERYTGSFSPQENPPTGAAGNSQQGGSSPQQDANTNSGSGGSAAFVAPVEVYRVMTSAVAVVYDAKPPEAVGLTTGAPPGSSSSMSSIPPEVAAFRQGFVRTAMEEEQLIDRPASGLDVSSGIAVVVIHFWAYLSPETAAATRAAVFLFRGGVTCASSDNTTQLACFPTALTALAFAFHLAERVYAAGGASHEDLSIALHFGAEAGATLRAGATLLEATSLLLQARRGDVVLSEEVLRALPTEPKMLACAAVGRSLRVASPAVAAPTPTPNPPATTAMVKGKVAKARAEAADGRCLLAWAVVPVGVLASPRWRSRGPEHVSVPHRWFERPADGADHDSDAEAELPATVEAAAEQLAKLVPADSPASVAVTRWHDLAVAATRTALDEERAAAQALETILQQFLQAANARHQPQTTATTAAAPEPWAPRLPAGVPTRYAVVVGGLRALLNNGSDGGGGALSGASRAASPATSRPRTSSRRSNSGSVLSPKPPLAAPRSAPRSPPRPGADSARKRTK